MHEGNLFQSRSAVIETQVGVGGAHDLFIIPIRPGGSLHDDTPLSVVLVASVAAVRQGLDGDAELAVIGIGRGAGQRGAVALRAAQDKPSAVRVFLHDALAGRGGYFLKSLDGLDLLPLFTGEEVTFIDGDNTLIPRAFRNDGFIPLNAASLCKGLETLFLINDGHCLGGGVPLIGINLDGISLRDGFSASIPGDLGGGILGNGQFVGGSTKIQDAVSGTGNARNVSLRILGNLDLRIVCLL